MPKEVLKHQRIARVLAGEIHSGALEPGSRLPGEHALTRRFAVSRTTVRQALDELSRQGYAYYAAWRDEGTLTQLNYDLTGLARVKEGRPRTDRFRDRHPERADLHQCAPGQPGNQRRQEDRRQETGHPQSTRSDSSSP
jgi:DNA-binding transcriptional MocR family regulator